MSYYGKEAYPIYNRYSTRVVAHTLKTYSKYSLPYPYRRSHTSKGQQGGGRPISMTKRGRATALLPQ